MNHREHRDSEEDHYKRGIFTTDLNGAGRKTTERPLVHGTHGEHGKHGGDLKRCGRPLKSRGYKGTAPYPLLDTIQTFIQDDHVQPHLDRAVVFIG